MVSQVKPHNYSPIPQTEWDKFSEEQKKEFLLPRHQGTVLAFEPQIRLVLETNMKRLAHDGPITEHTIPGTPWDRFAILIVHESDIHWRKLYPEELWNSIWTKEKPYQCFPIDKIALTGGKGAPKFPDEHPYKSLMADLAGDPPEEGMIQIAVFADMGASIVTLKAGMTKEEVHAIQDGERAKRLEAREALIRPASSTASTPSTPDAQVADGPKS